ncbi:MAG TPA: hypothetical protein VD735_03285, partial [Candidatus Saccharimonadales bacterium]|nr:hypothetical protein [Candidatus Saccharimonadales bacterium]
MKKVRLLIATLAVSVMGFATFLAPATPVGATSDDKEAMVNVQDAVDEFADITYDASELDDAAYYSTVIAAADDTIIELERNKAVLAESTEEGEAWVAIKEMTRLISRMQNQLRLMQTNAREGDIEGYDRTVDGYNATADEYFAAVSDYDYNLLDSSETVDATAGFYIIAIWPALGILVGTIVWAAQDKLLEQAKRLRRARALIAVLAGLAFIGLVGMAIVHTLSSAFPVAIAVAVGSLAAMAIALRIKYSEAARKARPAATTTDNTQLVVPVSSFVWLN